MARAKVTRTFFRHFTWKEEVIVEADSHDEAREKARPRLSPEQGSPMPDDAKMSTDGAYDSSTFLDGRLHND